MQKEVVVRCRQAGKAVIVASHLLQSMIEYPTPTRAEVCVPCSLAGAGPALILRLTQPIYNVCPVGCSTMSSMEGCLGVSMC